MIEAVVRIDGVIGTYGGSLAFYVEFDDPCVIVFSPRLDRCFDVISDHTRGFIEWSGVNLTIHYEDDRIVTVEYEGFLEANR